MRHSKLRLRHSNLFEFSPVDFVTLQPAQCASKTLKSRPYINFTIGSLLSEIWYHQLFFINSSFCLFSHQGQIHCKLYSNWTNHQGTYFFDFFVLQIIREALETKQLSTAREMCLWQLIVKYYGKIINILYNLMLMDTPHTHFWLPKHSI